jgi:hypothetical protein
LKKFGRNMPDWWWTDLRTPGSPSGSVGTMTPLSTGCRSTHRRKQLRETIERQVERFREEFGRDPGPEDPIFFDPDADEPRPRDLDTVTHEMTEGLRKAGTEAGVDPALIEA